MKKKTTMKQAQIEFPNHCIFDKMAWPDDNSWIFELIEEARKKQELDKKINNGYAECIIKNY